LVQALDWEAQGRFPSRVQRANTWNADTRKRTAPKVLAANRVGNHRGSQMKRIMGILIFQNMNDALKAMDVVEDAGYELNIHHDLVDVYSAAVFVEAWRYVASDTDEWAAISAIHDELDHLVDPFTGLADDVGVFAEGELHDFYGTDDGTRANPQFRPGAVRWSPPVAGPEC
jgi:hypothetical protein